MCRHLIQVLVRSSIPFMCSHTWDRQRERIPNSSMRVCVHTVIRFSMG
jgi:hypothetical protein